MEIKSDIQIAQEAHLENIKDVAAKDWSNRRRNLKCMESIRLSYQMSLSTE